VEVGSIDWKITESKNPLKENRSSEEFASDDSNKQRLQGVLKLVEMDAYFNSSISTFHSTFLFFLLD